MDTFDLPGAGAIGPDPGRRRLLAAGVAWVAMSAGASDALAANKAWSDPLDTPAKLSRLATSTQLVAIAQAGKRLVAVGWRGHVVVSDDDGATWRQVPSPVSVDLTAVSFMSAQTGWVVGHGGLVMRTDDGGMTWRVLVDGRATARQLVAHYEGLVQRGVEGAAKLLDDVRLNTKTGAEMPWLDVHFVDANNGWVSGSFGLIMGTSDGGRTWTPLLEQIDNPGGLHLTSMAELDGSLYIASEEGKVFRKDRGSERFVSLETGYRGTFFGVIARAGAVVAFGLRGRAFRSTDRGQTWTAMKTGTSNGISAGVALEDGSALLVTVGGELLHAPGGSSEFAPLRVEHPFLFAGVAAASSSRAAVIVGSRGPLVQPYVLRTA